jgi:hypothetical protein
MEGLAVVDSIISFWTYNWSEMFLFDQYVKKQSGHGMSIFNGSSVVILRFNAFEAGIHNFMKSIFYIYENINKMHMCK